MAVEQHAASCRIDAIPYYLLARNRDLLAANTSGNYGANWNGLDSNGRPVSAGTYHYQVSAVAGSGAPDAIVAVGQGPLTGFDLRNGVLRYQVGGTLVRPADVTAVQQ